MLEVKSKLSRGLRPAVRSRSRCFCNSTWICASSRAPNTYEGPGSDFTARTAISTSHCLVSHRAARARDTTWTWVGSIHAPCCFQPLSRVQSILLMSSMLPCCQAAHPSHSQPYSEPLPSRQPQLSCHALHIGRWYQFASPTQGHCTNFDCGGALVVAWMRCPACWV